MILRYPIRLPLLYPAVLLSGATGLLYEVVWTRRLSLVLGSTTGAVAAVLSAFMLGLAAGAVLVGRRADASRRPLRWYGLLEIGIGVYAVGFESLLGLLDERWGGPPWLLAFLLLLLPTALMGGTLPVLARAAADTAAGGARALGQLYGVNTLGAVLGALLTTLVLLAPLGLDGTTLVGAAVNIGIGAVFWALGTRAGDQPALAEDDAQVAVGEDARVVPARAARVAVIAAFFASGIAGLALQVAWTRVLVYALEGFTIAFGLMLSAYLLGLGGGAIAGTRVALASRDPRRLMARLLLLQGVLALATLPLVEPVGAWLEELRRSYAAAEGLDLRYGWSLFLAASAIVLPATFVGGMLLPAVARVALFDRRAIGRQSGVVYAASTMGAVIAPPLAAFVLVPWLGVPGTIAGMALLLVLAGTALSIGHGRREVAVAAGAGAVLAAAFLAADVGRPMILRSHVFRAAREPRRLVASSPGSLADVSVVEEVADGVRRLYLDGFSAAETARHYAYMRLLGHLPVLMHPHPERVCVIAFGTGTTAGAAALHSDVREVVCVEIEEEVYRLAFLFGEANHHVLRGDKAVPIVADGREYVAREGPPFDVITLEPLMPYTPAAVYLYTREFYEAARARLGRNGLLCQWIPPQGVSERDMVRLIRSVDEAFPWVSLWYFEHAVLVLAGEEAPGIDPVRLQERASQPDVAADLDLARVGDGAHLLSMFVCTSDALDTVHRDAPAFTDDRTDLEFRPLPRRFGKRSQTFHAENLELLSRSYEATPRWMGTGTRAGPRSSARAALDSLALEMRRRIEGGVVVPASDLRGVVEADPGALFARSVFERRLYAEWIGQGRFREAATLTYAPDRSAAWLGLARATGGEERRRFLILAVRENSLLEALPGLEERVRLLEELARSLDGPELRFCRNRARILRGEDPEPGEERRPALAIGSVRAALDAGDLGEARALLAAAYAAGRDVGADADRAAWEWWEQSSDAAAAFPSLVAIGSRHALRAALRLFGGGTPEGLRAVAPYFAQWHPANDHWARLTRDDDPGVREAAAAAASARAHLPELATLCGDPSEDVRLAAWLAYRAIAPEAEASGYDHRAPTPQALETLRALAR